MTKLTTTLLLLLISIAFFHCLAFRVEFQEFEPPEEEEQETPGRGRETPGPGRETPGRGRETPGPGSGHGGGSGQGWEEEYSTQHPYHFGKRSFKTWFRSREGFVKTLPKFTKRAPNLYRGIENYRFSVMEMEPLTFLVPHHWDADSVVIVLQSNGVIEFVTDKTKQSFHVTKGDVVRIPSGVTHFVTNVNDTVPLRFAKISVPVNIPGKFKNFFPSRSRFQQSYFNGFTDEVLAASLSLPEEVVRRLIKGSQQREEGIMRSVSEEQIKELTKDATSPSNKHKDKDKDEDEHLRSLWKPFNLLEIDPIYSNHFGNYSEATPNKISQLQDLHIAVGWANMRQGSLLLPQFNSRTTFVTFVENGCARFEMASPYKHQKEQQQEQQWWPEVEEEEEEEEWNRGGGQVQRIVSHVCKGDVFILPAGHPFAILSKDPNFVIIGFGIHATNNKRTFLAGEENLLENLDTVATRLTFGFGSKLAGKLFKSQNWSHFAPVCRKSPDKLKPSFQSIFNLAGF